MKSNTLTSRSAFIGTRLVTTHRPQNSPTTFDVQPIQMSRVCQLTGKKPNNGFRISFSHKRNKHRQNPNLQKKMIYWPEGQRYVKLKISTKAMRTIEKKGLEEMAKEAGIDLWKLPFRDVRPERLEYLKDHPMEVPMKKRPNAMKNPEKIANSKKKPLIGRYADGRIYYTRDY